MKTQKLPPAKVQAYADTNGIPPSHLNSLDFNRKNAMKTPHLCLVKNQQPVTQKGVTRDACLLAMAHAVAPNYLDGCGSGKAAANLYLMHLKHAEIWGMGLLQHIVLQFCEEREKPISESERDAIRGKIVGVFTVLEIYLKYAIDHASTKSLQDASVQSMQEALQDAAEGGSLRRYEEEQKIIKSEQCRQASRVRWKRKKAAAASAAN